MVGEFEELWQNFLRENPDVFPTGKKGAHIESLEGKLQALQTSKESVQAELQRQLDFFEKSKGQLESNFERTKADAQKQQEKAVIDKERQLESIRSSTRQLEENAD